MGVTVLEPNHADLKHTGGRDSSFCVTRMSTEFPFSYLTSTHRISVFLTRVWYIGAGE